MIAGLWSTVWVACNYQFTKALEMHQKLLEAGVGMHDIANEAENFVMCSFKLGPRVKAKRAAKIELKASETAAGRFIWSRLRDTNHWMSSGQMIDRINEYCHGDLQFFLSFDVRDYRSMRLAHDDCSLRYLYNLFHAAQIV
jgi:hypothetical protein